MSDYLCDCCIHCQSVKNGDCRCEYEGLIEMKTIEVGQSAYDVCEDFEEDEERTND